MKSLTDSLQPIVNLLKLLLSKHMIIVIVLSLSALLYAVFTVNRLLSAGDDEAYRLQKQSSALKTRFDQDTINKLDQLKARQEQASLDLPAGRINPFAE